MSSLAYPTAIQHTEISYQEQETITEDRPAPTQLNHNEMSYQEQETITEDMPIPILPKISDSTVTGGYGWVKIVVNIVRFPFKGLMWTFDGSKFEQFPSQETPIVFPVIVSNEYLILTCGMKEDGSLVNDVLEFGTVRQVLLNNTGKDLIALTSFSKDQDVYLVDNRGNIIRKVMPSEVVLLKNGWKLVSPDPFIVFVRKV